MGRRFMSPDTSFSANSARAQLRSEDSGQLNGPFLLEARQAVGDCEAPDGTRFPLFTGK